MFGYFRVGLSGNKNALKQSFEGMMLFTAGTLALLLNSVEIFILLGTKYHK
jgi:hypothetical protein